MASSTTTRPTVVLTGATSGIGEHTAHLLATEGARLIIHGPQPPRGQTSLLDRLGQMGAHDVHYLQADFDRLAAADTLAGHIAELTDRVDVLINNAGRPGPPTRQLTGDGNERTLQTNYLAPVLLTARLTPLLRTARGRVVHVSSATHLTASLDVDDLTLHRTPYSPAGAYSRSKLALVAHARWLTGQAPEPRFDAVSVHPGVIRTPLLHAMFPIEGDPPPRGAHHVVQAALATGAWNGQYLDEDTPARPNPLALDAHWRNRLMRHTFRLLPHDPSHAP
ncbi:SDR family NAD(P)-dependent oxidoreductase [Streptomyces sp. NPDC005908]|uniref:SDR family NAD(P)-dependent oxidoreductase n=1 Tax=Streptomyces sp. NPDC005908 TaxID=3157084 RepID=UPI0033C12EE1